MTKVPRFAGNYFLYLDEVNKLFDEMFKSNEQRESFSVWKPDIDVIEDNTKYMIYVDIPGCKKGNIKISVIEGELIIKGKRDFIKANDTFYYHTMERQFGEFERIIQLSEAIIKENIDAKYNGGVLEVIVPKVFKDAVNKIEIN